MQRPLLILVGIVFTGLALLGAVLPGLPTTPFLIVALWAFARSSERMTRWLERIPILQSALVEARRFEERKAVRPSVKVTALAFAWGSAALTTYWAGTLASALPLTVVAAAVSATAFMLWIPTDRTPMEPTSKSHRDGP
ncbi:MAG TPA: YbaN family protein [Hyphomicrobiaceae bacterium]|nr:YbaN family protein [Hyphomicrobiaceae bacterium]